jgi:excinuclease ABC subunit B
LDLDEFSEYSREQLTETLARTEHEMREAAKQLQFEKAAELRDRLKYLRERELAVR